MATSARLRRTFHYPDDNTDSDSQPDAIDEQEQQDVIARLAAENAARNARFGRLLVALPLLAALPYLPLLVRPRRSLLVLLALTSLGATVFVLRRLPPHVTGITPLDAWARGAPSRGAQSSPRPRPRLRAPLASNGSPLETYLPYLNAGLVVVLLLMGMLTGRGTGSFGWIGLGNLPAIVYSIVLAAKMVMASVDPERELSALKYNYKGA